MKSIFGMAIVVFGLTGCAAMQKDFESRTCNYDAAYEHGVNDAQKGAQMQGSNLAMQCPSESKEAVSKGYRNGYMSANEQNANSNLVNGIANLLGRKNAQARKESCNAKENKVHQNFCSDMDKDKCGVHSSVCIWN